MKRFFNKPVIGKWCECPTKKRCYNRNPPIIPWSRKCVWSPAGKPGKQPRSKVTCRVNSISGIRTERYPNRYNRKPYDQRRHILKTAKTDVFLIDQCINEQDQQKGTDNLVKERDKPLSIRGFGRKSRKNTEC